MERHRMLAPLWRRLAPPWVDARYLDRRFGEDGPVITYREFGRPVVAVRGLERGLGVLQAGGTSLRSPVLPYTKLIPRGFIRYMRPEDRQRYRSLVAAGLSPAVVHAHEAETRRTFHAALDALGDGAPRPWLAEAALRALARLFAGVAPEHPAGEALLEHVRELPVGRGPIVRRARARAHLSDAAAVLRTLCSPSDATFVGVLLRHDPGALDDDTLAFNLVYMLRTGASDLGGLLHWLLWELARHPDWLARCADERVAAAAVSETLRLHQTEYLYRRTSVPVEHDGVRVSPRELLRVCVAESHRDGTMFPDPERFDPHRFLNGRGRPARDAYLPFGAPGTACLGAGVTLALANAFSRELALFELHVTADGEPEHDGWHWRPSGAFRVRLRPSG